MDIIKVEPDSDSDCRQMSSLNDDCLDGVKDEQQNVPEVANDAKVSEASLGVSYIRNIFCLCNFSVRLLAVICRIGTSLCVLVEMIIE